MAGKKNMLFGLSITLIILSAVLVFLLSRGEEEKMEASGGTCMLTDFVSGEVSGISIENSEGNYNIVKNGNEWKLTGYEGYEMDEGRLEMCIRDRLSMRGYLS